MSHAEAQVRQSEETCEHEHEHEHEHKNRSVEEHRREVKSRKQETTEREWGKVGERSERITMTRRLPERKVNTNTGTETVMKRRTLSDEGQKLGSCSFPFQLSICQTTYQ